MKHATVRLGEYEVPPIGILKVASQERCDLCRRLKHISDVTFDGDRFVCKDCKKGQR